MRITQSMTDRKYIAQNNRMQSNMLKNMTRIMTQKQYTRASEDSVNASKALTVRRQLKNLDMYDGNLKSCKEFFTSAESNLYTVANNIYINVQNKLETACNGTYDQTQLDIFAEEIEQYAKLSMETLNSEFAERKIFGGTNNSQVPFTTEVVNGKNVVKYNGVSVDDAADITDFPGGDPIYVDIGIGIKYNAQYEVDPQTAMDVSLNGAEITGFGCEKDADGNKTFSNNFVQMMFDAAAALKDGDVASANATLDRLNKANTKILTEITTLGTKQNSIDFYVTKNEDYRTSLKERQNDVEGCDMNKEITDYDATNAAYQAILQMSANILPKSIFDFI